MKNTNWESENPNNEQNPYGYFRGTFHKECVCLGEWLRSANEIFNFNDISKREIARAIRTALEKGRGKKQNIMLADKRNCGKSFILRYFQCFC